MQKREEMMKQRARLWALFLVFAAAPAVHAKDTAPPHLDVWEVAHLDGARVGYVHTTAIRRDAGSARLLRATWELDLTLRRRNALIRLRMEHGTDTTPEGKIVGVFMRQQHPGGRQLLLTGALDGDRMHVKIDGGRIERKLRWSKDALGLQQQETFFASRKPRPGDRLTFVRYEPTLNSLVTVRAAVKDREVVDVLGKRKSLLRVELAPDKIEVPGHSVQPPRSVWWLDADFVPVRRQFELEGLGAIVLTRTTREVARAPVTAIGKVTDIGLTTLVPLNRAIPRPYATRSATYRITLRGDPDPGTALVRDGHQEVRNLKGNTFELLVHPVRPAEEGSAGKAPAEFLASCHYIDSADARVKLLARQAVGTEKGPWKKALRIERYVKGAMRVDNAAPMVPAGQVARTLRGDCRAFALLTAALCRAEGLPARTAIGLVYVERSGRPYFGFHMWTEVWIDGRWLGLDATFGQGGVGATHIKVTDHSWHATPSLTPLLPLTRVLGKIAIEVVRVERE
jgi:hypothetical protein